MIKEELQEQLEEVKRRLLILDMVEARLLEKKSLYQQLEKENLRILQVFKINRRIRKLKREVNLLNEDSTPLS